MGSERRGKGEQAWTVEHGLLLRSVAVLARSLDFWTESIQSSGLKRRTVLST